MKVFLSWSGNLSHRVALVLRDWLPSVIQTLEPYVSSEDIDKGARWSTDIASELENSSFGILCVTRDNITAPWLTFEAGALSKTMDKSFVCPFLFDIKRSEVGGPILQFQSTVFDQEDVSKLLKTLNNACGENRLEPQRLEKALEIWYPDLESELNSLSESSLIDESKLATAETEPPKVHELLEEILELSRTSQKLLRSPEGRLGSRLDELSGNVAELVEKTQRSVPYGSDDQFLPNLLDEVRRGDALGKSPFVHIYLILALIREPMPWIYEAGTEVVKIFRSRKSTQEKVEMLEEFHRLFEFSLGHPTLSSLHGSRRLTYSRTYYRELPSLLQHMFMEALRWRRR